MKFNIVKLDIFIQSSEMHSLNKLQAQNEGLERRIECSALHFVRLTEISRYLMTSTRYLPL